MQTVRSIKKVEHRYMTGEMPLLVTCSDYNAYICKYMRSSASAYKLACELIGHRFADIWKLNTPKTAFVMIKPDHWPALSGSHSVSAPCIGSRKVGDVLDVTPSTIECIERNGYALKELLLIALFDFWIANEDRNSNNYNLLYDVSGLHLLAIDFGCIFNTATYDYPMSQLTSTDTVLYSELFDELSRNVDEGKMSGYCMELRNHYDACLSKCRHYASALPTLLPDEWHIPKTAVEEKLRQLFESEWTDGVWNNFTECLKEYYVNGKIKI